MCGGGKPPSPPPPPPQPPQPVDPAALAVRNKDRKKGGFFATLLTGQGGLSGNALAGKPTLLGQ